MRAVELTGLPPHIRSEGDWRSFERWMLDHGVNYNPDDGARNLVNMRTGSPTFSRQQARRLDSLRDEAFGLLGDDVYRVGLREMESWLRGGQQRLDHYPAGRRPVSAYYRRPG